MGYKSPMKACWKTHEMIGTKMKDGRRVPNCVPKDEGNDSPAKMTSAQYSKKNAKMRKDHKGPLSKQQTKGKSGTRTSFACRFGKNPHPMKAKDGTPSGYAHSLKRWGFGSPEAARSFCDKNKKKK